MGLTFGADKGQMIRLFMSNQREYIGRPLNIAARLQAAVKDPAGSNPSGAIAFPFEEVAEAHQYMELNEQVGKIVLTPGK